MRHLGVDRDEFATFYATHKDRCLRAARAGGMGPDRAEDAVAEAFARAWARWRTLRCHRAPEAWVLRTAVNADISWWRKHRREVSTDSAPEVVVVPHEGSVDLIAAIGRLSPRQREVVVLRYLLDLDTAATAEELGLATGTVTAHLHHALAALRQHLEHQTDLRLDTERVNL
jgi:RNA polymerase sigma-70 factor (ECF subfamily)